MRSLKFKFLTYSQVGIGLVELLIAIALGSLVSIAVVQLFIQNKDSYVEHENVTRLQENGRFAIQLLSREMRSADYWGCLSVLRDHPLSDPDPAQSSVFDVTFNVNGLVPVTDSVTGTDGTAGGTAGFPFNPDTLTITSLQRGRSFKLADAILDTSDDIKIDLGAITNTGIAANDLLVIGDCTRGEVFQVTNDPDDTIAGGEADLTHAAVPAASPPSPFSNATAQLSYTYDPKTTLVYSGFVGNVVWDIGIDNTVNPPIPSLRRNGQPLVPGVENMQVSWGIDTDNDRQPDRYVNSTAVADWEQVITARISLLVRSPEAQQNFATGYNMDGFTVLPGSYAADVNTKFFNRRVYSTTITLRNRST